MRIPAKIQIFGRWIFIDIVPLENWSHEEDVCGWWDPHAALIEIRGDLTDTVRETTYFHELTHAILDSMSHALSQDEVFVDQFASLLHQALTSAKYSRNKKGST